MIFVALYVLMGLSVAIIYAKTKGLNRDLGNNPPLGVQFFLLVSCWPLIFLGLLGSMVDDFADYVSK